ncbi:MAG: efflux RND transporter periplasmic adaptor subunit [Rhodocyclaceae bacterium]|nr:efflux RND transporter periplasmic adaptor subunit [Rhodocyclaceae bacterium]
MTRRTPLLLLLVLALAAAAGALWWQARPPAPEGPLTLHGNVDFRQASIPFNATERIEAILVEEGARVTRGEVLARLDTARLRPQLAQAEAAVLAQEAVVARLENGTRKEEIAQARASLAAAEAAAANASAQFQRRQSLGPIAAVSQQDIDQARAAADTARAQVEVARNALSLALLGPRPEDLAQARAQLQGQQAQLALLRQQLADAELKAPFDAVVQARLMEPGEMATPTKPVLSLATTGTKWIRAYVPESRLSRIHSGARAHIHVDSLPDRSLPGWVGFISSVAEFTPKTVQTEDLRSSLVYQVRVLTEDAGDALRLGMPATVTIDPDAPRASDVPAR